MNDNAKLWVEALESGKHKQTGGTLGGEKEGYCCLGVACKVYEDTTGGTLPRNAIDRGYVGGSLDCEFTEVREWLGLSTCFGNFGNNSNANSLVNLNDAEYYTFKQIAEVIKSEPDGLFITQ